MKLSFVLSCLLLFSTVLPAAHFYVSPKGNDKNPGSAKAPFATIKRAAEAAAPGDTVKIGPGLYREQFTLRKAGKPGAPITFVGTRGPKGEFLSIVEPTGTILSKWTPAPEIAPGVWKTPVAKRPDLILMDGAMIAYINKLTMALPDRKELPAELYDELFWDQFGPKCKRLGGMDLLRMPADIKVRHQYFRARKEYFWPVISHVLSGWRDGWLYVRFANGDKPQVHSFSATYGHGFVLLGSSHLTFKDLHVRGSRGQFRLTASRHITVDSCLMMHGGYRVLIEGNSRFTTVKNSILTAGFIRNDLFQLRSADDMRGGLLYLIFKYIIGYSSSDDVGVRDYGGDTLIHDNIFLQGLIGVSTNAPRVEVTRNVVREMSSIGILTVSGTVGKFHRNLIMNCGIPLRIHHLRHKRRKREEYHYNNLFVQAPRAGGQIYVHCTSFYKTDDAINFEKRINARKRVEYHYKENPPNPVDAGKFYIYHNTFWGGNDHTPCVDVIYLHRRFRMKMPFFVINNIYKDTFRHESGSCELTGPNLLYSFSEDVAAAKRRDPKIPKVNKVVPAAAAATIWNKNNIPGLPDMTLAANSPALGAGIDLSKPFTVNGQKFPAFPGLKPGYFKGKAPAAGAFQQGESQEFFNTMHRRAEAAVKMLNQLKKNALPKK